MDKVLNAVEVAEILGIKKSTVYKLLNEGSIPSFSITDSPSRRTLRVRVHDLEKWVQKRLDQNLN